MLQLPPSSRDTARSACAASQVGACDRLRSRPRSAGSSVAAHLDAERALAGRRQHLGRASKTAADARLQAEPHEPGGGQHDGVVAAVVELAQPGVEVAAQRLDAQVGAQRAQLHQPAQARRADAGALGQLGERRVARRDEGVARILALEHGGQLEAVGQVHRHVLQRMHRQLRPAVVERGLELLHEQPLAADLRQAAVEDAVALRGHRQQADVDAAALAQQAAHMLGLPQREAAFAGGDEGCRQGHAAHASRRETCSRPAPKTRRAALRSGAPLTDRLPTCPVRQLNPRRAAPPVARPPMAPAAIPRPLPSTPAPTRTGR